MCSIGRAAGQLVITFSEKELSLLDAIEKYAAETDGNKSAAAKVLLKAAVGDPIALASVEAFRKMKGFIVAALPVAPEFRATA